MSGQLPAAMGGVLYCNPFAPLMVQSPSVFSKRPAPSDENLESSKKKKKPTRTPKTGAAVNWKQINVIGGDNAPVEARTLFEGGEQDGGMRGSVDADMQESSEAADALQASVAAKKPAKKSLSGAEKRKRKQAAAAAPATSERRGAPRMLRWLHSGPGPSCYDGDQSAAQDYWRIKEMHGAGGRTMADLIFLHAGYNMKADQGPERCLRRWNLNQSDLFLVHFSGRGKPYWRDPRQDALWQAAQRKFATSFDEWAPTFGVPPTCSARGHVGKNCPEHWVKR